MAYSLCSHTNLHDLPSLGYVAHSAADVRYAADFDDVAVVVNGPGSGEVDDDALNRHFMILALGF